MQIRRLTTEDIPALLESVNGAFADYIVPFQLNAEQLEFKIRSEDILMDYSVGVFDEEKLIAFIMHGVRHHDNIYVVYNGGTGVLPDYRGKGLVGKMYAYILPFLKDKKTEKTVLEVIESNQSAIRAYEKQGFNVNRKLLCFSGQFTLHPTQQAAAVVPLETLPWADLPAFWDITPSWQSDTPSMLTTAPNILGAFLEQQLIGYVLFNPTKKRIYQLAVAPAYRRKGIGQQLCAAVQGLIPNDTLQINNIDEASVGLKLFFERQGLTNDINQLEMVMEITN